VLRQSVSDILAATRDHVFAQPFIRLIATSLVQQLTYAAMGAASTSWLQYDLDLFVLAIRPCEQHSMVFPAGPFAHLTNLLRIQTSPS